MRLFNFFNLGLSKKSSVPPSSATDSFINSNTDQAFINQLLNNRQYDLVAHQAVNYYKTCSPVGISIDWITTEAASITPLIYDTKNKIFEYSHPLLDLLNNPHPAFEYNEFMESLLQFYLLTGNTYLITSGEKSRPPIMIETAPPQNITYNIARDGYPLSFTISQYSGSTEFFRTLEKSKFKYYDKLQDAELFQIRNANPTSNDFKLTGLSPLNQIYYEIEQCISGNIHNLSLLKRGSTLGGIFTTQGSLSDEAFRRLQNQINIFFSGENNAGRPFLAEEGLGFTSNSQSNRDMDFVNLRDRNESTIYNKLKVPLPLVSKDTMIMANFDAAKIELYDRAVLPLIKRIFANMTSFLMPAYQNSENLILSYDAAEIPALEPRSNESVKTLKDTNLLTTNELRAKLGYDDVNGGNELYQPANLVPFTDDDASPSDDD